MVNAKDTLNEYNKTKGELDYSISNLAKEKKEIFGLSKDQKQVFVDMLKGGLEKDQINKIYKQTYGTKLQDRKELTQKYKEENKDLIAKYKELNKQKKLNEEAFKELTQKAKELGFDNEEQLREMIMGSSESKESKETVTKEYLLNKPNMTAKDKEGMQKSIDYLIEKKMDTSENLKKLDAIVYTAESIEVGGVKRARKDITAKPNGNNIFQHNNVTYFKRSESMIKQQNDLLAKQGMEIPLDSAYESSMRALPGEYSKTNRYEGGNILALITDMSMYGYCDSDGGLNYEGKIGSRWSAGPGDDYGARGFRFNEGKGELDRGYRYYALPVRPVLK